MDEREPFILLDDARADGARNAQLYEKPRAIFAAHRPDEVENVLEKAEQAQAQTGGYLAGYLAYEAGLALEGKLKPLADERSGGAGPLVWFGLFDSCERIASQDIPAWLEARGGTGEASIGPLEPQISTGGYLSAFDRLQEAICAGDIYQANLTMPLAGAAIGNPIDIYRKVRPAAAAGYGGLIFDGSHWLLSFSPELFFTIKDGEAKAKPMKGTRPRGRDDAEDLALKEELASSVKDKAENLMIVDLLRNDMSRVAEPGTVQVNQPFQIETYPTVHTMVSTIQARLQEGKTAMDMLRALYPCGSITGAPKIRAMELIQEVERDARGPYCGAIGRIGPDGSAAFNVAIRTVHLTPGENERHKATLGVGGAIVADSEGMSEWRECLVKGGFVRGAASGADLIESMLFDPENGIELLELHLERMKASAAELGFSFDRHDTRNRIQALCFELEEAAKLRILLSRSGEVTLQSVALGDGALPDPVICAVLPLPVVPGDWRLRHKSTDRSFYDAARSQAQESGALEAIFVGEDGLVTEASYSNIFLERDGILLTPPLELGLLPGVQRRNLIEQGRAKEAELTVKDLAQGFLLGNSVRGLMKAKLA